MEKHERYEEALPALAVDALPADEARRLREHIGECPPCQRMLATYEEIAAELGRGVKQFAPQPALKIRTMRGLPAAHRPSLVAAARQARLRPLWLLGTAAMLAALLALGFLWQQNSDLSARTELQQEMLAVIADPDHRAASIPAVAAGGNARALFYFTPKAYSGVLHGEDLPALKAGEVYQIWLTAADGSQTSGGTFSVDRDGKAWALVRAPRHMYAYTTLSVTSEGIGGARWPTSPPVVKGSLERY
jgi:hypothetical protein